MRAMIMAAGLGTRLMPLTATLPKPMVPILGRPALGHILDLLRRHEITEVVVNLHHFPDSIRDFFGDGAELGMSIAYAYEEELLGTAGGVKNNEDFFGGDTFLVLSGDSLTDVDLTGLVAAHRASGGIATLGVTPVDDTTEYGVVVRDESNRVLGFQEKPSARDALSNLCNCGIYVFEPEIFDHIPAGEFYDFGRQVFFDLLEAGLPFHAHEIDGYWSDVGGLDAYRDGNFDALEGRVRVETGPATAIPDGALAGGRAQVGPGCVVATDAALRGPVVVGAGSVVGPGSRVAETITWEECRVEAGSVVEGSILARGVLVGPGASVRRAVLGEGCRVAAGSSVEDQVVEPGATVGG